MTDVLMRCSGWSAAHPWRAVAGWLCFVVLCVAVGTSAGTVRATTEDYRIGEAGRAEAMAAAGGLQPHAVENVLITRPDGGPLDPGAAGAAADDVADRMRVLPQVRSVEAPRWSADGSAMVVAVTMAGPELEAKGRVDPLLAQTAAVAGTTPELRVAQVGPASIGKGVDRQRSADLLRTEIVAVPVTVLVLFVVFGSLLLAMIPLLLAATAIAAAIGLSMPASHVFPDAGVGTNIILLIGLAVGVDYTLFYLKREREERERSGGTLSGEAIVRLATATAGRTVVLSGLAVIVSSATLYLADDVIFSSVATGAITVTAVAVLSALTVLPAVVTLLGRRAERRGTGRRWGRSLRRRTSGPGRLTGRALRRAGRRPVSTLVGSVVALLVLAVPMIGLSITDMGRETHSREIPEMVGYDRLNGAFPDLIATNRIVVADRPERSGAVAAELDRLAHAVTGAAAGDRIRISDDGGVTVLDLPVPHHVGSEPARAALADLREQAVPRLAAALPGADVAVTGDVARYADYPQHQAERLPLIIAALLLVTFTMTAWAFRSIVLGALGVVLNLLSAAAAMGVVVAVFQPTWAEGLLDFTSTGSIGSRVPLFLLVILFGLSMDYQFFVLSRIREAVRSGLGAREAVLAGMSLSGRVVTSASVVMVTVFGAFAFLHLIEMKQIGLGLAVAVLLDAFVVRLLVLPSVLLLLGDKAWWPGSPAPQTSAGPPGRIEVARR
ncbi:MMPL family transporter [Pseudonocardia parietis]|uniref:RND superfamily putative drug exporter n=1 Tax=Pseudonocardia parietis TaxID=570936 RepID=A0ABS4VS79_9PSEU|nr:MMPL family transporter [Pseudonocardia parietis]MBP2366414.1 RND superfamily putative drug exporter [Pseudonocardia parietis]